MTIQHFTHPSHPLAEVYWNKEYRCGGCKTLGTGKRYRCDTCDFDLHEHCGTCPTSFSSFMHPQHQLNLVVQKVQGTRQNDRVCDLCGDQVEGLFYRCEICEFDVHPLCTQLPQYVRHAMHPDHPLTLQPSSPSCCMVCKTFCTSWRYRCAICSFDLHLECVLEPCDAPSSRCLPPPPPPSPSPPTPYDAYAYYGVPSSSGQCNMYPYVNQAPPYGAYANYGVPSSSGPCNMYPYVHQAPPFGAYANYGVSSSSGPSYVYPYVNQAPPYGYGVPSSSVPYNLYPYDNQAQGGGATNGKKDKKKMYSIVANLALGVLTNIVFGVMAL